MKLIIYVCVKMVCEMVGFKIYIFILNYEFEIDDLKFVYFIILMEVYFKFKFDVGNEDIEVIEIF